MTDTKKNTPAVKNSNIVDSVLAKVNQFEKLGEIRLPKDFSAENALKSAYLILQEQTDNDNKSVLESCSRESIANSLLDMVVQGLSPMKKQCAFVPYGGKLTLVREYHGTIALAKRFGAVKDISSNVIYENDKFEYTIDPDTGRKKVIKHEQSLDNIDINKIKGAYATLILGDDTTYTEVMTIVQIKTAWNQGYAKGESPAHKNFTDQMAIKTVINRACKLFISSSDDGALFGDDEPKRDITEQRAETEIEKNANKENLNFDEAETVDDNDHGSREDEKQPEKKNENGQAAQETEQAASGDNQSSIKGPGF